MDRFTAAIAGIVCFASSATGAQGKVIVAKVDARSAPWHTGINDKMRFGLADARPATVVWNSAFSAGLKVHLTATGSTTTVEGGVSYGPEGCTDWATDHGMALFPSHYIDYGKGPVYLNELVGTFIDADGKVVGRPFGIGSAADVVVPLGAAGLSLGINDDRYSDNTGSLTVTINVPDPTVTVEPASDQP